MSVVKERTPSLEELAKRPELTKLIDTVGNIKDYTIIGKEVHIEFPNGTTRIYSYDKKELKFAWVKDVPAPGYRRKSYTTL